MPELLRQQLARPAQPVPGPHPDGLDRCPIRGGRAARRPDAGSGTPAPVAQLPQPPDRRDEERPELRHRERAVAGCPGYADRGDQLPGRSRLHPDRDGHIHPGPQAADLRMPARPVQGRPAYAGQRGTVRHRLLDSSGCYTNDIYLRGREDVVQRQQQEMLEPARRSSSSGTGSWRCPDRHSRQRPRQSSWKTCWKPSSGRNGGIIDITGVPTVDALVLRHLLKTAAAAKLMGARLHRRRHPPQIAASRPASGRRVAAGRHQGQLRSAFAHALKRTGVTFTATKPAYAR